MKGKFEKTKTSILAFEENEISMKETLKSILDNTGKSIAESDILNYWRFTDIDGFVKRLVTVPISNRQNIDDRRALDSIKEILEKIDDDAIFEINAEALENRYAKSRGTISDWIFHGNMDSPKHILDLLKKNTTIIL